MGLRTGRSDHDSVLSGTHMLGRKRGDASLVVSDAGSGVSNVMTPNPICVAIRKPGVSHSPKLVAVNPGTTEFGILRRTRQFDRFVGIDVGLHQAFVSGER